MYLRPPHGIPRLAAPGELKVLTLNTETSMELKKIEQHVISKLSDKLG
jgi:hypothetical protein